MTSSNRGNPPGLPEITYQSGTHATFLQRMLERLNTQTVPSDTGGPPLRPLAALTTRDSDDPTIALLDAWATVADTLSFYQDRIANEGYLRTATERRSVLELTRAVGYELSPGVAAETWLAFEVDDAPDSPASVVVPAGTKVQSIPAHGQMPQVFETAETFTAHVALNSFRPHKEKRQELHSNSDTLLVEGAAHNLRAGNRLLLDGTGASPVLATIKKVDSILDHTRIKLTERLQTDTISPASYLSLFVFRKRVGLFGHNAPNPGFSDTQFFQLYKEWEAVPDEEKADKKKAMDDYPKVIMDRSDQEWKLKKEDKSPGATIVLDAEYAQVAAGGWVAVSRIDEPNYVFRRITAVDTVWLSRYGISGQVTRLTLKGNWADELNIKSMSDWRTVTVYVQSDELRLSETVPYGKMTFLEQGRMPIPLEPGFKPPFEDSVFRGTIILAGRTGMGEEASERVRCTIFRDDKDYETDQFKMIVSPDREKIYKRNKVTFHGNLVRASHGETVTGEVLGSGNASLTNQRFVLRHTPLTYVAAATASGGSSTLSIRVNGLLWDEVPSLLNQGPTRRCYTLQRDNRGRTIVIFGDGVSGARLPTGTENVIASYRYGLGPDGNVAAGALTLLQTRPYGIRSVSNPIAASGGSAPATLPEARALAPSANLPMGRLVSLADYAHFAHTFAGVGKAEAKLVQRDGKPVVCVTISAENGGQISAKSELYKNLLWALRSHGNPLNRVELVPYLGLTFGMRARVFTDPHFSRQAVIDVIHAKLKENYSFERRIFGQGISSTELITDIQTVPGVMAVDLDKLYLDVDTATAGNVGLKGFTEQVFNAFLPLLIINPENIHLEKWT